jgi:hypothetical protein
LHSRNLALPTDRRDDIAIILEVEIQMPRGWSRNTPNLAPNPDQPEFALDHPFDRARQFRDGEFGAVTLWDGVFEHVRHGLPCVDWLVSVGLCQMQTDPMTLG